MDRCKSRLLLTFVIFPLIIISCKSTPETAQHVEEVKEQEQITAEEHEEETEEQVIIEETPIDYGRIIEEQHALMKEQATLFIGSVNNLIKDRNFRAWESLLSPQYIEEYASADNLHRISETIIMRNSRIVLRSLEDYFIYVVVPSRASISTDEDIEFEFLDENNIQAFAFRVTSGGAEQRVMLYELEKIGDSWKIIK